jgi:PAS domain S-box-containing protein
MRLFSARPDRMFAILGEVGTIRYIASIAILAACYFLAAKATLIFAIPPGYATAVWPPSGIALAALLLWGMKLWPGVWLGAAFVNYTVNGSISLAASFATGNTLEGICAAWLAHRLLGSPIEFRQPESVFMFTIAAAAASVIAASTAVLALYTFGAVTGKLFAANWFTWWLGDVTGILVITPLVLAWARGTAYEGEASTKELTIFWTLLAGMLVLVFGVSAGISAAILAAFPLLPFMAWGGCRFSERMVTLTVLVVSATAILATAIQQGPFAYMELHQSLLFLQAFTCTVIMLGLVLCALTRQRAEAMRALARSHDALEITVHERTAELQAKQEQLRQELANRIHIMNELQRRETQLLDAQIIADLGNWEWDARSDRFECSDQLLRIYGLRREEFESTLEGFLGHIHHEDRDLVSANFRNALDSGDMLNFEARLVCPDGRIRNIYSRCRIVRDATGRPLRVIGICQDITDRKRAEEDLRNYAERLKLLSRRLIEAQEIEYRQLARELHNIVGPNLTALGINLRLMLQLNKSSLTLDTKQQISDCLANCLSLVQKMAGTTRNITAGMRPTALDDQGLLAALRLYASRFAQYTGLHVTVEGDQIAQRLPEPVDLALFRIAQEALNNVAKHSRAQEAKVTLSRETARVTLTIEDDGQGFDPEMLRTIQPSAGWGLLFMQERAESVGARFNLHAAVGKGVQVRVDYAL